MKIAREGIPFAAAGVFLAGACFAGSWLVGVPDGTGELHAAPGAAEIALALAGWAMAVLSVFVLWFFRNPEPHVPMDEALVVAPGQGKVILIEDVEEPDFIAGAAKKISIFLSVFDVHVQRSPVTGTVGLKVYRPGTYAVAWAEKASEDNEQSSLGIVTEHGKVLVKQIAGLVARRIITDPDEGDTVERGRRFGLIRFGSRVDLFLPPHWEILCSVGDRVTVGSSPMARMCAEEA
ncbi:MAG: phosphatidylserine decarboxylase [Longimicrobiales bacterium]